ncbi:MAG: MaoC family dehydratase [Burkholderiaceae bacterium]|nr:MaoC family dehydratase [Burkholderiaceae bacterium]
MEAMVGTEAAVSDWTRIDQSMVDAFANLTGDRFFIHVDPDRAARESPHGGTILHGFLTLSMLPHMTYQVCPFVEGTKSMLNYGLNRLRFVAPVPTGSRIRGRFFLKSFDVNAEGRWTSVWNVTVDIEGAERPAIVAEWLSVGFL